MPMTVFRVWWLPVPATGRASLPVRRQTGRVSRRRLLLSGFFLLRCRCLRARWGFCRRLLRRQRRSSAADWPSSWRHLFPGPTWDWWSGASPARLISGRRDCRFHPYWILRLDKRAAIPWCLCSTGSRPPWVAHSFWNWWHSAWHHL